MARIIVILDENSVVVTGLKTTPKGVGVASIDVEALPRTRAEQHAVLDKILDVMLGEPESDDAAVDPVPDAMPVAKDTTSNWTGGIV